MIIVTGWYGRLGNNINQLCNIIDIALFYKHNIIFKVEHKLFNLKIITDYFSKNYNNKILTHKYNFFYKPQLYYPKDIVKQNNKDKIKLLKDSFLIKDIKKLDENDLVIHIRSGDIFSSNPHQNYVPPPLSYYIKQIDKFKYKNIIIICEDKKNPVVNKLLELYKNAIYNKNSLEQDIKLILGATNIISSVGTFVSYLLLMSNNIKYHYGEIFNNKELKDYYKIMKPWKNTNKQRDYILTYKYN